MPTNETYFQVEFYSDQDRRWVPLFAREPSLAAAEAKARDWLPNTRSRVTKVVQTVVVVKEYGIYESKTA